MSDVIGLYDDTHLPHSLRTSPGPSPRSAPAPTAHVCLDGRLEHTPQQHGSKE